MLLYCLGISDKTSSKQRFIRLKLLHRILTLLCKFHGMHPYYGESHLYAASPTLVETVSESANNEQTVGLENNVIFTMNGQHPHISSYLHMQSEAAGLPHNIPNAGANFSPVISGAPTISYSHATGSSQMGSTVTMSGYSNGSPSLYPYPISPISTAPTLLFRSPALIAQTAPSTAFQFSSPTFSSPPIQMVAPMGTAGQTTSVMSSMWQHTVPTSMPWAFPSTSSLHTFSATNTISRLVYYSQLQLFHFKN